MKRHSLWNLQRWKFKPQPLEKAPKGGFGDVRTLRDRRNDQNEQPSRESLKIGSIHHTPPKVFRSKNLADYFDSPLGMVVCQANDDIGAADFSTSTDV